MKFADKISVIVPVYNVEQFLQECLDSILSQSYDNLEVILVDDGSSDGSADIIKRNALADARIVALSKANGGPSDARNLALDNATGKWLMFVDSDDMLAKDAIELLWRAATECDADMAAGGFAPFREALPQVKNSASHRIITGRELTAKLLYQTCGMITVAAWGKLISTRAWGQTRFTSGLLYEDLELMPRKIYSMGKVVLTDATVYCYRTNPDSILGKMNAARLDALDAADRLASYFADDEKLAKAAADRRLSAAFNMLMIMGASDYRDDMATERCIGIIRSQRRKSLFDPAVRSRNKAGILLSYLIGIRTFKSKFIGRNFQLR